MAKDFTDIPKLRTVKRGICSWISQVRPDMITSTLRNERGNRRLRVRGNVIIEAEVTGRKRGKERERDGEI